jgi:hypothetical protein
MENIFRNKFKGKIKNLESPEKYRKGERKTQKFEVKGHDFHFR